MTLKLMLKEEKLWQEEEILVLTEALRLRGMRMIRWKRPSKEGLKRESLYLLPSLAEYRKLRIRKKAKESIGGNRENPETILIMELTRTESFSTSKHNKRAPKWVLFCYYIEKSKIFTCTAKLSYLGMCKLRSDCVHVEKKTFHLKK